MNIACFVTDRPVEHLKKNAQYATIVVDKYFMKIRYPHHLSGRINTGALYIMLIMAILIAFAFLATGPSPSQAPVPVGTEVKIDDNVVGTKETTLQLYMFEGITVTPPTGSLCNKGGANTNPELIVAYSPEHGSAVRSDGQIKVWLNGPAPFRVAPEEKINRSSGQIKTMGDRSATAPDGFIWEPALYIFPNTVDKGGRAFFPNFIRGSYNNSDQEDGGDQQQGIKVSYGAEPVPPKYIYKDKGRSLQLVWNVRDLGLGPGFYQLQVMVHGGDGGRAIACWAIRVYKVADPKYAIPD